MAHTALLTKADLELARWQGSVDTKLQHITDRITESLQRNAGESAVLKDRFMTLEQKHTSHYDDDKQQFADLKEQMSGLKNQGAVSSVRIALLYGIGGIVLGAIATAIFESVVTAFIKM